LGYGLNNVIQSWNGTSFATPYVSAAAATLLSANTGLDAELIVNALVNTSVGLVGVPPMVV
jgi:subtilisin family serine protease